MAGGFITRGQYTAMAIDPEMKQWCVRIWTCEPYREGFTNADYSETFVYGVANGNDAIDLGIKRGFA